MSELLCYNRGCGQSFDPAQNAEEACCYHPGAPYFHDAYKGWTCCQKKATDFTEFLNFPGCTRGQHSRVKPEEPANITGDVHNPLNKSSETVETTRSALVPLVRPKGPLPLRRLTPTAVAASLPVTDSDAPRSTRASSTASEGQIPVGEACKNGGCRQRFTGGEADGGVCQFHPGGPIFHEGLKFWSCCQKRTSDFQAFLDQVGCQSGHHCWRKSSSESESTVACRYDWHQTATKVTVAIYAKMYDPRVSLVELSPVRMKVHLFFPDEDAAFDLDLELQGVVNVDESVFSMMGTKVEIHLAKAGPGSWTNLNLPSNKVRSQVLPADSPAPVETVDALDLNDLDLAPTTLRLSTEASNGRIINDIV